MKIGNTIYLDHQATTPTDDRVFAAMEPFYRESIGNPHSSEHSLGWKSSQAVEQASTVFADLLGASADEVVFTSGATEANNQAVLGLAQQERTGYRKRIVISSIEHKCVIQAARAACDLYGFTVDVAPVDKAGLIDLNWLQKELDETVLLVSVMAVNNEIGTIQDIPKIADIVHSVGALFHSDCAQAPMALDMSGVVEHLDMASFSAHKMYGPKGIGTLWIERSIQSRVQPIIHGGGQQKNMRSGTVPVPLVVGLGAAARLLLREADANQERSRLRALTDRLVSGIERQGISVALNSPTEGKGHPGNVNIRFIGLHAQDILQSVQPLLAASTGSACTSGIPEPSHVLRAIGLLEAEAEGCIRFSVGRLTTEDDIDQAVRILSEATYDLADDRGEITVNT
jgi:cysteine desulfurase